MTGADVLKISAPLIAMGGVWVARKALAGGYQAATGNQPPSADDLDAPLTRVLVFAAGAAVVAALVNTIRPLTGTPRPRACTALMCE